MLALVVLLGPPKLAAGQHPTAPDYGLAVGSTALIVADWSQSLRIARNPARWARVNPLLGQHPSEGRANSFLSLAVVSNGGALLLPKTSRRIWDADATALEMFAVIRNLSGGISVGF